MTLKVDPVYDVTIKVAPLHHCITLIFCRPEPGIIELISGQQYCRSALCDKNDDYVVQFFVNVNYDLNKVIETLRKFFIEECDFAVNITQ